MRVPRICYLKKKKYPFFHFCKFWGKGNRTNSWSIAGARPVSFFQPYQSREGNNAAHYHDKAWVSLSGPILYHHYAASQPLISDGCELHSNEQMALYSSPNSQQPPPRAIFLRTQHKMDGKQSPQDTILGWPIPPWELELVYQHRASLHNLKTQTCSEIPLKWRRVMEGREHQAEWHFAGRWEQIEEGPGSMVLALSRRQRALDWSDWQLVLVSEVSKSG